MTGSFFYQSLLALFIHSVKSNDGSVRKVVEQGISGIDFRESKQEEVYVSHATELASEGFDFGVEGFSRCIGASIVKEAEEGQVVILKSSGYCSEKIEGCFLYFVVPEGKLPESYFFNLWLLVDSG